MGGAYQSWNVDESNPPYSGIGVVQMTTDRFACLTPMNTSFPGTVTLKPTDLVGICKISANIDALQGGELRVELLSVQGYVIDGYSKANATVVSNVSDIGVMLTWKGQHGLPNGTVMIRAHL